MISRRTICIATIALIMLVLAEPAKSASLDPGFGQNGTVITQTGNPPSSDDLTGNVWAIAEDQQDRLLAAGGTGSKSLVVRYLHDGTLDPTFGNGGRAMHPSAIYPDENSITANRIRALSVLQAGRILLAGEETLIDGNFEVPPERYYQRLLPDGAVDTSFATFPNYIGGPPPFVV